MKLLVEITEINRNFDFNFDSRKLNSEFRCRNQNFDAEIDVPMSSMKPEIEIPISTSKFRRSSISSKVKDRKRKSDFYIEIEISENQNIEISTKLGYNFVWISIWSKVKKRLSWKPYVDFKEAVPWDLLHLLFSQRGGEKEI
jgi:hypothetical protein